MPYKDRTTQLAYWRRYRRKHAKRERVLAKKRWELRKRRYYAITRKHKRENPCVDCGETNIKILEFDHIDPKTRTAWISHLMQASDERLLSEIAKCAVRCGPCHRRRTRKQVFAGELPGVTWWHITDEQAVEIKRLYETGEFSQDALGRMFNTVQTNISQIVRGKRACIRDAALGIK